MTLRSKARLLVSLIALASVVVLAGCASDGDSISSTSLGKPCSATVSCDAHLACVPSDVANDDGGAPDMFCAKSCATVTDCEDITCESILSTEHPVCGQDHYCFCSELAEGSTPEG